jgi:hypothetical protein
MGARERGAIDRGLEERRDASPGDRIRNTPGQDAAGEVTGGDEIPVLGAEDGGAAHGRGQVPDGGRDQRGTVGAAGEAGRAGCATHRADPDLGMPADRVARPGEAEWWPGKGIAQSGDAPWVPEGVEAGAPGGRDAPGEGHAERPAAVGHGLVAGDAEDPAAAGAGREKPTGAGDSARAGPTVRGGGNRATAAERAVGPMLVALWRSDRAAFLSAVAGRPPEGLLRLVAAAIGHEDSGARPLVAAARAAAARNREPTTLLRKVLECIVEDRPIDLERLSADGDEKAEASSLPGRASAVDWAGLAAVLATGEHAVAAPERMVEAAVSADARRVADMLAGRAGAAARIARFVAASRAEDRVRLLDAVRPGYAECELIALEVIWAALPGRPLQGRGPAEGAWRFALLDALGDGTRADGVVGLIRRAVAYLEQGRAEGTGLAEVLLARLAGARQRYAPAPADAAAQVVPALRAIVGGAQGAATVEDDGLRMVRAAGLVLVGPFLPMLFERLELTERGRFRGPGAAERGVAVLQAVAHGVGPAPPDERPLERLICGVPWERRLPPPAPLDRPAVGLIEGLLASVIERWSAIGGTSVAGLREAFLQREGLLRRVEAGWTLEVQPRAFDMLLDRLPWSIAVLKLGWMSGPMYVKWRK